MAKLTRVSQKLFAQTSGIDEVAQFGSLAAGSPVYTLDPAVLQALSQFSQGWFSAVLGDGNPAIEDMNSLFVVAFYQLADIFQDGVPAWDAGTTYYTGSIVQDGTGTQFVSTLDNNTSALNVANWFPFGDLGPLSALTIGNITFPVNRRYTAPTSIHLAAGSTVNVTSTNLIKVPDSVVVPAGSSLIVASGGSVRII